MKDRWLVQSPVCFFPHLSSYLQSKKLVSSALPPAEKRNTALLCCLFLQRVFFSSSVHPAGDREGQSRQGPPLERTGSEMWSLWKGRQSSSGSPESCWAKSSWPPVSRSSGLPAGAQVPAEWQEEQRRFSKGSTEKMHFGSYVNAFSLVTHCPLSCGSVFVCTVYLWCCVFRITKLIFLFFCKMPWQLLAGLPWN